MSMTITLKTKLFRADWDQARSQYCILWFLEALCRTNQSHIRQFKHLAKEGHVKPYPRLYKSGIHYERERGTEEWLDIPTVLEGGSYKGEFPGPWGDCEDLACWRVAELRELEWHWAVPRRGKDGRIWIEHMDCAFRPPKGAQKVPGGIKAKPFAKFRQREDDSYAYHALLLLPNGRLEDPSLTMGMTWEKDFHDRQMSHKYQTGELPVQIRYAEAPDVVVVDPESPTGFSSNVERAKQRTGLSGVNPFTGYEQDVEVSNESPEELAAYGYNRHDVNKRHMRELQRLSGMGFRSGRLGRLGRIGNPEANWARRFLHQANVSQSVPAFSVGRRIIR
jgi:hypothetical protein